MWIVYLPSAQIFLAIDKNRNRAIKLIHLSQTCQIEICVKSCSVKPPCGFAREWDFPAAEKGTGLSEEFGEPPRPYFLADKETCHASLTHSQAASPHRTLGRAFLRWQRASSWGSSGLCLQKVPTVRKFYLHSTGASSQWANRSYKFQMAQFKLCLRSDYSLVKISIVHCCFVCSLSK